MHITPVIMICKDAEELAARAAEHICETLGDAVQARGRGTLVLSGGSTPEKTYVQMAQPKFAAAMPWNDLYVFWGDERFVPPDAPESNFAMAQRSLLSQAPIPQDHVFPIRTEFATPAEAAADYARALADVFGPSTPPRFDLILLGLGDDGHIASLFPHAPTLDVQDAWVVSSPPGTLPPPVDRITLTFPVLNAARHVLFLVAGEAKAAVLEEVLEGGASREIHPAAGVQPTEGTVTWLVDEAAAQRLHRRAVL